MSRFFDSNMFTFGTVQERGGGRLQPLHFRDLGEKKDELYDESISWNDVVINGVPLEKTFEYEDEISQIDLDKPVTLGI